MGVGRGSNQRLSTLNQMPLLCCGLALDLAFGLSDVIRTKRLRAIIGKHEQAQRSYHEGANDRGSAGCRASASSGTP